ncbi:ABC transporter permease [Labrys okinawensis]|uniref:ABC transporter permease n=1 Tax=Labrys okinawensis TaxID=346911 RepID=UPI0039BC2809
MKKVNILSWLIIILAISYFIVPLLATFEFSLRMLRGQYSFEAYRVVFVQPDFQIAFGRSILLAFATIILSILLVVPAAYLVRLRLPSWRSPVEFVTLLPLVIPAIIIVFGYIRMFNSSSWLPLTTNAWTTDLLLALGYVTLALPYMYRSVDAGLRAIDVKTLTEAGQSLGASGFTILSQIILPNIRSGVLSGSFIAFAIVIGEFTFASLLNRPVFGTYLQLIGANRAYEPSALAIVAFIITWACMGLLQLAGRSRAARPAR